MPYHTLTLSLSLSLSLSFSLFLSVPRLSAAFPAGAHLVWSEFFFSNPAQFEQKTFFEIKRLPTGSRAGTDKAVYY